MAGQSILLALSVSVMVLVVLTPIVNCTDSPSETRVKRQSYSSANAGAVQDGNNFIDSIFQIPISTLNAVGSLIKNTRPIVMRARERIQQQYDQYQQQQQQQQGSKPRPSRGSNYYNTNKRVNKNKRRRSGIQGRDYPSY
ncbi:hypothetical protein M8J75_007937 [Diaphorina citri]|nr:hypothetical protein M8J75_007937 [Diaphorina citri]